MEAMKTITIKPDDLRRFRLPEKSIKMVAGMVHSFRFTPGERMVFHCWRNKYQPTEDHADLFKNPWCPLFGVLPFDDALPLAKGLIKQLRTFFGVPITLTDLCPEAYPDPEVIFELTGYSQVRLTLARYFLQRLLTINSHQTHGPIMRAPIASW